MSIKSNKENTINFIKKNIHLFCMFEKVYVFGSILEQEKYSYDIDILLLYLAFSSDILISISKIIECLEKETCYPVDITALSFEEEKDIGFIDKLDKKYVCIK